MDKFTRQFFETALWSSTDNSRDDGGDPLDKNYSITDIDPVSAAGLAAECADFQRDNADNLVAYDLGTAGHDFWLTRNGHGAGFWDGDYDEPQATKLTKASKAYGGVDLYVGDDGVIYASGYEAPRTAKKNGRSPASTSSAGCCTCRTRREGLIMAKRNPLGARTIASRHPVTVDMFLTVLTSKLTQYDQTLDRKQPNIYRLGLLLAAAQRVRDRMLPVTLSHGDPVAINALIAALTAEFTVEYDRDGKMHALPPIKNIFKQIVAYRNTGKRPTLVGR